MSLIFITSWKAQNSVTETERQDRNPKDADTSGGLLYWPFFNPRCDSIIRVLRPYFLDERCPSVVCCGPLRRAPGGAQHDFCPDLVMAPTGRPWLTIWRWYPRICNFRTPCNPVVIHVICFSLLAHASCLAFYTSCRRDPWLTALLKINMQQFIFSARS